MSSSFTKVIAQRYIRSSEKNRFYSWISNLSIAGVAIGVCSLIVVLSVINGFEKELKKRLLLANAHVMLYRHPYGISNYQDLALKIKKDFPDYVKDVTPFIYSETVIKHNMYMNPIQVRGINPAERESVHSLKGLVSPEEALDKLHEEAASFNAKGEFTSTPKIILGKSLFNLLDVDVGDTINLVAPSETNIRDIQSFEIIGTFESGMVDYDLKFGLLSLGTASRFFNMKGRVTGVEIGLFDAFKSNRIGPEMAAKYNLSLRDWQSLHSKLFAAMNMERIVIALIVTLVSLVASFNILSTMFVAVTQKQRDISILKSIGASSKSIAAIFIKQGVIISVFGSAIGVVLALMASYVISRYEIVDLPDIYILTKLPIEIDLPTYVIVAICAVVLAVVASLGPALFASKVSPAEGVRELDKI